VCTSRFIRVVYICGLSVLSSVAIASALAQVPATDPPATQAGQSARIAPASLVILEVTKTYSSLAESRNPNVYLRVFSDGAAECQSSRGDNSAVKKTLTEDEFVQIQAVLRNPKLAKVRPRYESRYPILDSSTEWTIKIRRTGQPQVIEVVDFFPGMGKRMKHPYPDALVKLGCSIEKLRADVSAEAISLDGECQRVLRTASQPKS
jgi:hypothetical protein